MPLKSGSSKNTVGKNISELMKSYKVKGKIGTSYPKNVKAAQKQAAAIAINKAKANESFDTKIQDYLTNYYGFKLVAETHHCKYAAEGCNCSECEECKANQK